jgi:hypothetical protein
MPGHEPTTEDWTVVRHEEKGLPPTAEIQPTSGHFIVLDFLKLFMDHDHVTRFYVL